MVYITYKPMKVAGGTITAECGHGAREALKTREHWFEFSSHVSDLEKGWLEELQVLTEEWSVSHYYFAPDSGAVSNRIKKLRKVASSLTILIDDLEAFKHVSKGTFFISYNHKDKEIADRLCADLRSKGYNVWRDQEKIRVGQSIRQAIEDGIMKSTFLLVLLSNNSVKSAWVKDEIDMAVSLEKELGRVVLLPIVLGRCKIPLLIKGRKWVSLEDYSNGFKQLLASLPNAN